MHRYGFCGVKETLKCCLVVRNLFCGKIFHSCLSGFGFGRTLISIELGNVCKCHACILDLTQLFLTRTRKNTTFATFSYHLECLWPFPKSSACQQWWNMPLIDSGLVFRCFNQSSGNISCHSSKMDTHPSYHWVLFRIERHKNCVFISGVQK